jgi:4-O-beta-D-mannosyl-D-glucose phosphorylase
MTMNKEEFTFRVKSLLDRQESLLVEPNEPQTTRPGGLLTIYKHPVVTREHVPISWRYDLNPETNPHLLERLGVNAAYNAGAMEFNGKIVLAVRTEGYDRKSIFAICESETGVDNFRFWDEPIVMPPAPDQPPAPGQKNTTETNIYDPRLVKHEDGWIYACFCAERMDPNAPEHDMETAWADGGIARTKDLVHWERLPNLKTPAPQQRNHVLFPYFVDGKYAFYTRPQHGFIEAGAGGGIGWGLCESIQTPVITEEVIVSPRTYHTVYESKNGLGPAPIRTDKGWLQLAHGVRGSASGLRYVLYAFLTDLDEPWKVIAQPGGYLLAPRGPERAGDCHNVLFSNGWVAREDGQLLLYYASGDTRMHVATTTVEKMLDYVLNTPADPGTSHGCAKQRVDLIHKNKAFLADHPDMFA